MVQLPSVVYMGCLLSAPTMASPLAAAQPPALSTATPRPHLQVVKGTDVLNSEVVRALLAHLRLGLNPSDDEALEAASCAPPRRLGAAFWKGLREQRDALYARESRVGGWAGVGG